MSSEQDIVKQIEDLEKQLKVLKLSLVQRKEDENNKEIVVGDRVKVLNPRKCQLKEGTVARINERSDFCTVVGGKESVRRLRKNLSKLK